MHIPQAAIRPHLRPLLNILGDDRFFKVCDLYGNRAIWFPKKAQIEWLMVCSKIYAMRQKGLSPSEISQRLNLSPEKIKEALKIARKLFSKSNV